MKTHTQITQKTHYAIQVPKVVCPICKSSFNHKCVKTKAPFTLLPANTVHVERVNELNSGTRLKE